MKRQLRKAAIVAVSALIGMAGSVQAADVTIGFQLVYGPWKANMEELKANGLGGKSIEFVKFTSGTEVINAMASGSVDISLNGSSPTAAGYSRGVDLQVIYIYDNINDAEALVVDDSITAPQDLIGKTIGVPFGSTTHFHMMFALEQLNISPKDLDVLDMSPPDMVAAWERGDINGGFVWDPALGRMKEKGRVLLTSGDLSNWGKATFDAMVARKGFTDENPEFTCQWVKMVSSADADYRANPNAYGPGTDNAMGIANAVSGDEAQVGGVLALYDYPTLEQQVSGTWLGGGAECTDGGVGVSDVPGQARQRARQLRRLRVAEVRADGAGRRLLSAACQWNDGLSAVPGVHRRGRPGRTVSQLRFLLAGRVGRRRNPTPHRGPMSDYASLVRPTRGSPPRQTPGFELRRLSGRTGIALGCRIEAECGSGPDRNDRAVLG